MLSGGAAKSSKMRLAPKRRLILLWSKRRPSSLKRCEEGEPRLFHSSDLNGINRPTHLTCFCCILSAAAGLSSKRREEIWRSSKSM
jgi:hypothetical protein